MKKVNITELKEMLKKGQVKFQYKKNDGSIRTAVGTLKSDLITRKPSGGQNTPPKGSKQVTRMVFSLIDSQLLSVIPSAGW